ncbi:MAG: YaaR family protein [Halanaerobiales bacterium]
MRKIKIDRNMSSAVNSRGNEQDKPEIRRVNTSEEVQFREKLSEINHREIKERLDKLFLIIDDQGEKLKKSLDKKDLIEYRKRVKDFLRILNKEFARAKQSFSWDRRGNMKTYTLIEEVDQNLQALRELFMEEQADAMEVLKRVDQIRGLLMDLYI